VGFNDRSRHSSSLNQVYGEVFKSLIFDRSIVARGECEVFWVAGNKQSIKSSVGNEMATGKKQKHPDFP
jgi:hypothetical protein